MDLVKDKTYDKFLWVQTFVKMTKNEPKKSFKKNIHTQ